MLAVNSAYSADIILPGWMQAFITAIHTVAFTPFFVWTWISIFSAYPVFIGMDVLMPAYNAVELLIVFRMHALQSTSHTYA